MCVDIICVLLSLPAPLGCRTGQGSKGGRFFFARDGIGYGLSLVLQPPAGKQRQVPDQPESNVCVYPLSVCVLGWSLRASEDRPACP